MARVAGARLATHAGAAPGRDDRTEAMRTLVVGLGNPILTDDGVGVKAAALVDAALPAELRRDVVVTEASVGGLRLMEMMIGFERAIIIDAILPREGQGAGTLRRLSLDDLRTLSPTQHSASAHDTTLVTALEGGELLGLALPQEIVIFAVEVENITDFGEEPTPAVRAAIPRVARAVLEVLGVPGTPATAAA